MHKIKITEIKFSDVHLSKKNSSALRGYISNTYGNISDHFHNHDGDKCINRYPLIQYKIIKNVPTLIGIKEGSDLLNNIFFDIKNIKLKNKDILINTKNIKSGEFPIGLSNDLYQYTLTDWMALKSENYIKYSACKNDSDKRNLLKEILAGNIRSFLKMKGVFVDNILLNINVKTHRVVKIKNHKMSVFNIDFVSNVLLPNNIGLGRNTAKGFGILSRKS